MSKFNTLLNVYTQKYGLIKEQSAPEPNWEDVVSEDDEVTKDSQQNNDQEIDPNNTQINPNIQQPNDSALPDLETAKQEQQANQNVADERELMLIRLIYKALTIDLDPSQYTDLMEIKDINQNNSPQILDKLQQIIDSY